MSAIVDVEHLSSHYMTDMIAYDLSDVGLRYFGSVFARGNLDEAG